MRYQPPPGVWRSTAARRLLWATEQALHYIEKERHDAASRSTWAAKLERAYTRPVLKFAWAKWYREHVTKDDSDTPTVPEAVTFAGLPKKIEHLWRDAAKARITATSGTINPSVANVIAGLHESAFDLVTGIDESARLELQRLMSEAITEGESSYDFARILRERWPGIASRKAQTIANTEWARASSQATMDLYRKQGVEKKSWLTAGDRRVCPTCEGNAGDGDIPLEQSFGSGDTEPPSHPDCRCAVVPA